MRILLTLLAVPALFGTALAPRTTPAVDIREWTVPWPSSRPRDPYLGPDGTVWFVGQQGNYVANLDPTTGEFRRYTLDEGVFPHNLIVAPDGMVWYAGNRAAHIGKLDPATGEVTKYPMPDPRAEDPHTLIFDGKGNIWFTLQGANMIGKLVIASGTVTLIEVPTPRARPYGIKLMPDGTPWIALFGTNKLATVDPATNALREIPLSDEGSRPRRLEIASTGVLWYVDYQEGEVGWYNPTTGSGGEMAAPSGTRSRPYGTAMDPENRLWFVETGVDPNQLVQFDTETRAVLGSTPVPSGGGTVRNMYYHQPTNTIWFGTDVNTIGRATLP